MTWLIIIAAIALVYVLTWSLCRMAARADAELNDTNGSE